MIEPVVAYFMQLQQNICQALGIRYPRDVFFGADPATQWRAISTSGFGRW